MTNEKNLNDDEVLEYTKNLRLNLTKELTSGEFLVPGNKAEKEMLIQLLDGMDRAAVNNKKMDTDEKNAESNASIAIAAVEMIRKIKEHSGNDPLAVDPNQRTSVNRDPGLDPADNLIDGELAQGVQTGSMKEFEEKLK